MTTELSPGLRRTATGQARKAAVADAAGVAGGLAEAAGVALGAIKSITGGLSRAGSSMHSLRRRAGGLRAALPRQQPTLSCVPTLV